MKSNLEVIDYRGGCEREGENSRGFLSIKCLRFFRKIFV